MKHCSLLKRGPGHVLSAQNSTDQQNKDWRCPCCACYNAGKPCKTAEQATDFTLFSALLFPEQRACSVYIPEKLQLQNHTKASSLCTVYVQTKGCLQERPRSSKLLARSGQLIMFKGISWTVYITIFLSVSPARGAFSKVAFLRWQLLEMCTGDSQCRLVAAIILLTRDPHSIYFQCMGFGWELILYFLGTCHKWGTMDALGHADKISAIFGDLQVGGNSRSYQ